MDRMKPFPSRASALAAVLAVASGLAAPALAQSAASDPATSKPVPIIRKRAQYLGTVDAPNEKAAEAAAVAEFDLSDEQCKRLVVQERN